MSSEASVQQSIRLLAGRLGVPLWRNNVGAAMTREGRPIRYGLANDSPAVNKQFKSADLVGILPLTILPEHVGKTIGVFISIECKRSKGGRIDDAQERWADLVRQYGGCAIITADPMEIQTWLAELGKNTSTG